LLKIQTSDLIIPDAVKFILNQHFFTNFLTLADAQVGGFLPNRIPLDGLS